MEKKLTDEEIVKALENQASGYGAGIVGDLSALTLDLIHRLQEENERLKSNKFASWKLKFFNLKDEWKKELAEHEEFTKKAKAEIERLTEEKNELLDELIDKRGKMDKAQQEVYIYQDRNAELQKQMDELKARAKELEQAWEISSSNEEKLQKQVDELKKDNARLDKNVKWHQEKIENGELVSAQAVKDTAKDSLEQFVCAMVNMEYVGVNDDLYYQMLELKDTLLKEKYGVEVE